MILAAVVFVVWPDLTQNLAKFLGVGRGADLVFYISILIFWFVVLKLYSRVRSLEQKLTETIRKNAIEKLGFLKRIIPAKWPVRVRTGILEAGLRKG